MLEHAVEFQDALSPDQVEYILKKANRLGLQGKGILKVFLVDNDDKTHVYIEIEDSQNAP